MVHFKVNRFCFTIYYDMSPLRYAMVDMES